MKIEITDYSDHIQRVQKMLAYFDILDNAGTENEDVDFQELSIEELREDEHIEHPDKLIDKINNYKGTYVRAPKMI